MPHQKKNKLFIQWCIQSALVLIWGTSYILMKKGLVSYPPLQVGALRIGIAFIVLLPFAIWNLRKIKKGQWKIFAIAGLIGSGIPAYLFAKAQMGIDSQVAGILNSVAPLFTLVVGALFFGFRTKWYNIIGVFIGLAGAIGLLAVGEDKTFEIKFGYGIYIIIATFLYATNISVVKRYLKDFDPLAITSLTFIFIGIPSIIFLLVATDFPTRFFSSSAALENFGYISILAIIGTALAGIGYNYLIKTTSILFVASVTYLIPLVAIFWGINDGEKFYFGYFIWMIVIFIGVFLVNKEPKKTKDLQNYPIGHNIE